MEKFRRLTITLSGQSADQLKRLQTAAGTGKSDQIRRCLITEQAVLKTIQEGGRLVAEFPDDTQRELVIVDLEQFRPQ